MAPGQTNTASGFILRSKRLKGLYFLLRPAVGKGERESGATICRAGNATGFSELQKGDIYERIQLVQQFRGVCRFQN